VAFVKAAGCGNASVALDCLVGADSRVLQTASVNVSRSPGIQGLLSFSPVIDGVYIKELLSVQMAKKRVNGERLFVGVCCSPFQGVTAFRFYD